MRVFRFSAVLALVVVIAPLLRPQDLPDPDVRGAVVRLEVEEQVIAGSSASSQGEAERREVFALHRDSGRLLEHERFRGDDVLISRSIFHYNDEGRLVQVQSFDSSDRPQWSREYRYTDSGKLEREISFGPTGLIEQVTAHQYAQGELEQVTRYRFGTEVVWRRVYRRDGAHALAWDLVGAEGERIRQVRQSFDSRGRLVMQQSFDQMGAIWEEVRHRYDADRHVMHRYGPGEQLLAREVTYFDAQGNPVRHEVRRGGEETVSVVVTSEYRYDLHANWVYRQTVHTGGDGSVTRRIVARRAIEYADGGFR